MDNKIKILHLEDSIKDSELIRSSIESGGIGHDYFLADNKKDFINILETEKIDIILCDYQLPEYNGLEALKIVREKYPQIPFIFVSGTMGEDAAINSMVEGAIDYVLKYKLERLVPAIKRAIREYKLMKEHKQAEEALKESEKKFRSYIENAPDGIFIVDNTGRYIEANNAACNILGYSEDEILSFTISDLLAEESFEDGLAHFNKIIETGRAMSDLLHKHKDGSTRWLTINAVRISPEIILGFATDITERKQAEETLRKELDFSHNLTKTAQAIILLLDTSGKIVYFNPYMEKISGYKLKEIVGQDWGTTFLPEDIQKKTWALFLKAISGIQTMGNINPIITKDKKQYIIEWYDETLKDSEGKITGLLAIGHNITKRKQAEEALRDSEEKLRTLFGSMTEMVAINELVYNEQGEAVNYRITECNNAFTRIMGIAKENTIGKLATEIFKTETPPYLEEFSHVAISGEPNDFDSYYAPIDKHLLFSVVSPKKNSFATITTDITAIEQVQEVIRNKNKDLENYLFVASHDLKSPLVNIQGFSQRLEKQISTLKSSLAECQIDPEIRESIEKIATEGIPKTLNFIVLNVAKMNALINSLTQLSRTGSVKMNITKVDMNQLFKIIIYNYNFQITEMGAKVIIDDLPFCYGDEDQLNQIFSNIIGNAIKYSDHSRKLIIKIAASIDYNKVIYSIKDTGIGISPRHLEMIWDVFYRVDSSLSTAGDGIGLSLAKRIADKHKGKIWAKSEEGKGSTFYVELQRNKFSE